MFFMKRLARKHFKKWDGILIFYMVYDPRKKEPNVISNLLHPDIKQDDELNELLKKVADKVRIFYTNHPELLEEAFRKEK